MSEVIKQRPIGVTIITIIDTLVMAIMPLTMLYISVTNVELAKLSQFSSFSIVSTIALSLSIGFYAFKTYKGSNKAKELLLILITIYFALIAFNNLSIFLNPQQFGIEEFSSQESLKIISNIVRPAILLLINYAYFRSQKVKEYFAN